MSLFKNFRFRTQIILVCIVILLLNSIACGSIYYNYVFKDTLKNYYSSSEDMVSQMRMHLTNEMRSITEQVHAMYSTVLYSLISDYAQKQDSSTYVKMLGEISDIISESYQGDRYIHSASIETEFGSFSNFTRIKNHDFKFMDSSMKKYFDENPQETICWYPAMVSPIFQGNEVVIPVVYKFRLDRRDIFVMVSLKQSEIDSYLKEVYDSYNQIFIADKDNRNIINCEEKEQNILNYFSSEEI